MVPVTRPMPAEVFINAVADRVTEALTKALGASAEEQARTRAELETLTKEQARTREAIEALRQEIAATREAQERIERSIEERDRKLTKALRSLTEKRRPWWVRILKRGDKRHEEG